MNWGFLDNSGAVTCSFGCYAEHFFTLVNFWVPIVFHVYMQAVFALKSWWVYTWMTSSCFETLFFLSVLSFIFTALDNFLFLIAHIDCNFLFMYFQGICYIRFFGSSVLGSHLARSPCWEDSHWKHSSSLKEYSFVQQAPTCSWWPHNGDKLCLRICILELSPTAHC